MLGFEFIDPYPTPDDSASDETDDFDISLANPNIVSQDLLEDLKQLDVSSLQRELADATIALQGRTWKEWSK